MGKPFDVELKSLPETYNYCLDLPIGELSNYIQRINGFPLLAVGSGGSLTAAHVATVLHQHYCTIAKTLTPLDMVLSLPSFHKLAILFLTAGGSNPDVLVGFKVAAQAEPRYLAALCTRINSPLSVISHEYEYTSIFDLELPCGKDGFLATNSLLASMMLLIRAYSGYDESPVSLPRCLPSQNINRSSFEAEALPVLSKNTIIVLYGGWGLPIAMDIESKFTEAALGNIQVSDYRNFAHGRHHWIAKREADTAVVAIMTPEVSKLAERTLKLLPSSIPVMRLKTPTIGPNGIVDLFIQMLQLVQLGGYIKEIDPGRPGVPEFGRRIYNMRYNMSSNIAARKICELEVAALQRKANGRRFDQLPQVEQLLLRRSYKEFLKKFSKASFGSIVFDYDGTLCDSKDRFDPLTDRVCKELLRILEGRLLLGIATGRGKSVRTALLDKIPSLFHDQILVGYYNGAFVLPLNEVPDFELQEPDNALLEIKKMIKSDKRLSNLIECEQRSKQITIQIRVPNSGAEVYNLVSQITRQHCKQGVGIVTSSHSIDIIASESTKINVVNTIKHRLNANTDILCIGDRGRWPGNDYLLLDEEYSLSVDEVSGALETCWNLSLPGHRGVQATIDYLLAIDFFNGRAKFLPERIGSGV